MVSRIAVLVPSRGRPHNIAELRDVWAATAAGVADLIVAVDHDDPRVEDYLALDGVQVIAGERLRLGGTLNLLGPLFARTYDAVGFMGDDHRPRTPRWDETVAAALDGLGTGIAYGNDLIHGPTLPTAAFLTSDIIRTLGWMCPPGLVHLEIDSAWKALGAAIGRLRYLPEVVIEHVHPITGKAEWDAGYIEANASEVQEHDRAVFERWRDTGLADDVERLRRGIPAL